MLDAEVLIATEVKMGNCEITREDKFRMPNHPWKDVQRVYIATGLQRNAAFDTCQPSISRLYVCLVFGRQCQDLQSFTKFA